MSKYHGIPDELTLNRLRTYLISNQWKEISSNNSKIVLFSEPIEEPDPLQIALPSSDIYTDTGKRMLDAIAMLSDYQNCTIDQTINHILNVTYDIIKKRIKNSVSSEWISLKAASRLVDQLRKIAISASKDEKRLVMLANPRIKQPPRPFIESARFAHTFSGSFGFTLLIPLPATKQGAVLEEASPFERKVTERIIRGLSLVESATRINNPNLIIEAKDKAFAADACEAVADLWKDNESLDFAVNIEWSSFWEPADDLRDIREISLPPQTQDVVRAAASSLREQEGFPPAEIRGLVTTLHCENELGAEADFDDTEDYDQSIVVKWPIEPEVFRHVKISLTRADYLKAVEAHRTGREVSAHGLLQKSAPLYRLHEPSEFNIL